MKKGVSSDKALELAKQEPDRIKVIDSTKPIENVFADVVKELESVL